MAGKADSIETLNRIPLPELEQPVSISLSGC